MDCGAAPTHAILYERAAGAGSGEDRETMIGTFRTLMLAANGQTVCARYEGDRRQGWRVRFLLPDGRDLPALNQEESRMRIVPAGSIDEMVKGVPMEAPRASGQPGG